MAISMDEQNALVKDFNDRLGEISFAQRSEFKSEKAYKRAAAETFQKRDDLKELFDDTLIEKAFGDNSDLDEIAEMTLELAKEGEYSSSFRGLAADFFSIAEIAIRAYEIGKR